MSMEVWAQQRLPNSAPVTHPDFRSELMLRTPSIVPVCLWRTVPEQERLRMKMQACLLMSPIKNQDLDFEGLERHPPLMCDSRCFAVARCTGLAGCNGNGVCLAIAWVDSGH